MVHREQDAQPDRKLGEVGQGPRQRDEQVGCRGRQEAAEDGCCSVKDSAA